MQVTLQVGLDLLYSFEGPPKKPSSIQDYPYEVTWYKSEGVVVSSYQSPQIPAIGPGSIRFFLGTFPAF